MRAEVASSASVWKKNINNSGWRNADCHWQKNKKFHFKVTNHPNLNHIRNIPWAMAPKRNFLWWRVMTSGLLTPIKDQKHLAAPHTKIHKDLNRLHFFGESWGEKQNRYFGHRVLYPKNSCKNFSNILNINIWRERYGSLTGLCLLDLFCSSSADYVAISRAQKMLLKKRAFRAHPVQELQTRQHRSLWYCPAL